MTAGAGGGAGGPAGPGQSVDPAVDGPLDRATALAILQRAEALLDEGDLPEALRHFQRVVGHRDPDVTAAALLGVGTVYFRADHEDAAVETWKSILRLPETPATYLAWRQLAAAYVREDRLDAAIDAYRQAERRAPPEDRREIASRLGWLTKETGDRRASGRYFARSRGGDVRPLVTYSIIAVTVVVSVLASLPDWTWLFTTFELDKAAVAAGEYWRLLTCTLLHEPVFENPLHLLFNMYALYFAGTIVERMYGGPLTLGLYVLTGIAASTASFLFGGDIPSVGASGAIFGLFGVLVAADRIHHPIVDRRSQAILGQVGLLIVLNLVLGFAIPGIDYLAHIGGLVSGLWLGVVLVPGRVPTLSSLWHHPGSAASGPGGGAGTPPTVGPRGGAAGAARVLGVAALVAVIVAGLVTGTVERRPTGGSGVGSPSAIAPGDTAAAAERGPRA